MPLSRRKAGPIWANLGGTARLRVPWDSGVFLLAAGYFVTCK